ncbi:MAG: AIR synthase related protein [archaeon]
MITKDNYSKDVIQKGDQGSDLLRAITVATLIDHNLVEIVGETDQLPILRFPEPQDLVVHSTVGNGRTPKQKANNLIYALIEQASYVGAKVVAISDIIDSRKGDKAMLREVAEELRDIALEKKIAILNGENAILGDVVKGDMNISGTAISLPRDSITEGAFEKYGNVYASFNTRGKAVHVNSDGPGTKTELYIRLGDWRGCVDDVLAMCLDDTIKNGATAEVFSSVLEVSRRSPTNEIGVKNAIFRRAQSMGIRGICQGAKGELQTYTSHKAAFNLGSTVVSTIDEERLNNPLIPRPGDYVIAIQGHPNSRANAISTRRRLMTELFGKHWHLRREGKIFLDYLSTPSTVLYPVFKQLVDNGLASGVFHMSGGAYNGKFAKPLAKHNLFARLSNLHEPDWREVTLAAYLGSNREAYGQFAMGNDGFATTNNPERSIRMIEEHRGLTAEKVGRIQEATEKRSGVLIQTYNGRQVYFSGREKAEAA